MHITKYNSTNLRLDYNKQSKTLIITQELCSILVKLEGLLTVMIRKRNNVTEDDNIRSVRVELQRREFTLRVESSVEATKVVDFITEAYLHAQTTDLVEGVLC